MLVTQNQKNQLDKFSLKEKITNYANNAFAKNTHINYQSDWNLFSKWCFENNIEPLKATHQTVTAYITILAEQGYKASTIQRKISAIVKVSEMNNHIIDLNNKEFKLVWQGIRRTIGTAKKGKEPILVKTLRIMLEAIQTDNPIGIRDKALLSFGWASAMRRSEIVQLNWGDIKLVDEGIIVNIRQSKTDQFGEGQKIAILYGRNQSTCPVKSLLEWKNISYTNEEAPVLCSISKSGHLKYVRLSDRDVARIVKKCARNIGLEVEGFAGHSLRSGLITTASKNSVPDLVIMKHSRHKTAQMIHVYTRDNSLISDNVTSMLGL